MYFVHPNDHERYALRMLLLYRKGISSFKLMRTVDGHEYTTFKETLVALGLANDDNEWKSCLTDAAEYTNPAQMRELYVMILINCVRSILVIISFSKATP